MVSRVYAPPFLVLYMLGFLFALQIALSGYYNIPFLTERGFSQDASGLVYIVGACGAIVWFLFLHPILRTLGPLRLAILTGFLMSVSAWGLAGTLDPHTITILLGIFLAAQMVMYSLIDTLIETRIARAESLTGRVRGLYLTAANAGFIVAPALAGFIVGSFSYELLYVTIALLGIVFCWTTARSFSYAPVQYAKTQGRIAHLMRTPRIRSMVSIQFLIRLMYAVTLMYLTIFLTTEIGLSVTHAGLLLSLSIIPFAIVQFPLGFLGDVRLGEKELLTTGITLMAGATVALGLFAHADFWTLLVILGILNTGAAISEIMVESYFFKHIGSKNDLEISAFRILTPLAYIVAPLLGALVLSFSSLSVLFVLLGSILFLGIPCALTLRDTR